MDPRLSDPRAVAELAEQIYHDRYKADYEVRYHGWFVVIDVTTGNAYLAPAPTAAVQQAQRAAPNGLFHLIRVGEPGAFRVSYRRDTNADRVLR